MIVRCESCGTRYNLDESLIKEEGSKVRCSGCKHVFVAHRPSAEGKEDAPSAVTKAQAFQETITLQGPPPLEKPQEEAPAVPEEVTSETGFEEAEEEPEEAPEEEQAEMDFDRVFEEVVEKKEPAQVVSPEDLEDLEMEDERVGEDEPLAERARERVAPTAREEKTEPVEERNKGAVEVKSRRSILKTVFVILVVLLVLAAGAAAALYFLAPELLPGQVSQIVPKKKRAVQDPGVSRLEFKGVKGAFVESKKSGQLLVVRGKVLNNYPGKRSYIRVRASILDEGGRILKQMSAFAGNDVSDDRLKVASLKEIQQIMNRREGEGGSNVGVAPGSEVPFMIVFDRLPENMQEFEVEAVRSRPAGHK